MAIAGEPSQYWVWGLDACGLTAREGLGTNGCKCSQVGDSCSWLGTAPLDLVGSLEGLESEAGISIPQAFCPSGRLPASPKTGSIRGATAALSSDIY